MCLYNMYLLQLRKAIITFLFHDNAQRYLKRLRICNLALSTKLLKL